MVKAKLDIDECVQNYFDSLKDTASYCGMSESKAKSMLHRTRRKLKKFLKKEGFYE
jgi:RNA polymerase sigma-70 factor (ECF subfamily)